MKEEYIPSKQALVAHFLFYPVTNMVEGDIIQSIRKYIQMRMMMMILVFISRSYPAYSGIFIE